MCTCDKANQLANSEFIVVLDVLAVGWDLAVSEWKKSTKNRPEHSQSSQFSHIFQPFSYNKVFF